MRLIAASSYEFRSPSVAKAAAALCLCTTLAIASAARGEQAWAAGDTVRIATSIDEVPYHFVDEDGRATGMLVDVWRLWSEQVGIEVEFVTATWGETVEMMRDGRADLHAGLFRTDERKVFLDYGEQIYGAEARIFARNDAHGIDRLEDLRAFTVAVPAGDVSESELRNADSLVPLRAYKDYQEILDAATSGDVRVVAGVRDTVLFHLRSRGLGDRFSQRLAEPLLANGYYPAVPRGEATLLLKVREGLAALAPDEIQAIRDRYTGESAGAEGALTVAVTATYPPFSFLNANGDVVGMLVDLWRLWSYKTGEAVRFRASAWPETLEALKRGEADIHSGMTPTKERGRWVAFSEPIYKLESSLFYRAQDRSDPPDPRNLSGLRVGVLGGTAQEAWLKTQAAESPSIEVIAFGADASALRALQAGAIDTVVQETLVMVEKISQRGLRGRVAHVPIPQLSGDMVGGVRSNESELLDKVTKGLSAISTEERAEIESRWVPDPRDRVYVLSDSGLAMSKAEQAWLRSHRTVRIAHDAGYAPIEFRDEDGNYLGVGPDLVDAIARRLKLRVEVLDIPDWPEAMKRAEAGEVDMLPAVLPTPSRERFLTFSSPYLDLRQSVYGRQGADFVADLSGMSGKRLGIVRGHAAIEHVNRDFPKIKVTEVDDIHSGFELVSEGEIDGLMEASIRAQYHMSEPGAPELKVIAETPYTAGLSIAVRKDFPELASLVERALAEMPQGEIAALARKWVADARGRRVDYSLVWKTAGAMSVLLALAGVWIFYVQRQRQALAVAERRTRESEARFRTLVDNAGVGIAVLSMDGVFESCNQRMSQMLELGEDALKGRPASNFFEGLTHSKLTAQMSSFVSETSHGYLEEHPYTKPSGEHRWGELRLAPMPGPDGQPAAVVLVLADAHERRAAAEAMERAKSLAEEASAAKSDFLANVSHELRTPMNAILGFAHIGLESGEPGNQDVLLKIRKAAEGLQSIIVSILDFARMTDGKLSLETAPFDLRHLANELKAKFAPQAAAKGLGFELTLDSELPLGVQGDEPHMLRVLEVLVENAVKFSEHGSVRVEFSQAARADDEFSLRVTVSDTGIGMDETQRARLFTAFSQAERSLARKRGGLGLGLSIAGQLCELLGASIEVASTPGEGSTFTVTGPLGIDPSAVDRSLDMGGALAAANKTTETEAESGPLDFAAARELISQITTLARDDDTEATVHASELCALAQGTVIQASSTALLRELEAYKFGAALGTIDAIESEIAGLDAPEPQPSPANENAPAQAKTGEGADADPEVRRLIEKLSEELREGDTQAIETLGTLARAFGPDEKLERARTSLEEYDFGSALESLRELERRFAATVNA